MLISTPHAVGPGSYEHGIPKSEPFLLQKRPSCIFQSVTPRLTKSVETQGAKEPVYSSLALDRAHWKPRFKGAGRFGTGKRTTIGPKAGDWGIGHSPVEPVRPGPGTHAGAGTARWPPPHADKSKLQLGGFKAGGRSSTCHSFIRRFIRLFDLRDARSTHVYTLVVYTVGRTLVVK